MRRILHCDMDCFYAAVHTRDDPSLRGKPVVIGGSPEGRGVVAAANYEVREFGVHSAMPAARAKRLCPHTIFLKPDFPRYRKESQRIFAIYHRFTPTVQTVSLDEAYLDVSDQLEPHGSATEVAVAIRREVLGETGLTVSIGVGPNRLVAKIASDCDKPDGLTVIKPHRVLGFLAPLPVRRILGVGPATEKALAELGVSTVAELRALSFENLKERFGRHGEGLYRYARGEDERPVSTSQERKSLSSENTYGEDLSDLAAIDAELERMALSVGAGLVKRELAARTITVKVRYGDFTTVTRSASVPFGLNDGPGIARLALELARRTAAGERPVRLLGVGASNLVEATAVQPPLFAEGGEALRIGVSCRQ